MRTLLILVFAALSVWLFTERMRLTDQVASLQEQLDKKQTALDDYAKDAQAAARPYSNSLTNGNHAQPGGARPAIVPPKPGWINEHVQKGARALDPPKPNR